MSELVFPLVPRRRVVGVAFGGLRSTRRGSGSDVAGSRPYNPGDSLADIDWAASARISSARGTAEFVVREHYADESPRVVAVADRRPAMGLKPPPRGRLQKGGALKQALASVAASARAARGLLGFLDFADGQHVWLPPRSEHQEPPHAGRFDAPDDQLSQGLALLGRNQRDLPRGSFVFVISDFLELPSRREWAAALQHQWDVVPVVIQDPIWERSFPDLSGVVARFVDPRSGAIRNVRLTRSEATTLQEENEKRWAALLERFRSVGLECIVIDSADPRKIASAFLRWADERLYVRGRA